MTATPARSRPSVAALDLTGAVPRRVPIGRRPEPRTDATALRVCTRCGDPQPPAAFPACPKRPDGLSSWCKGCHAESLRILRKTPKYKRKGVAYRLRQAQTVASTSRKAPSVPPEAPVAVGTSNLPSAPVEGLSGAPGGLGTIAPCQVPGCPDPWGGARDIRGRPIRLGLGGCGGTGTACRSCYDRLRREARELIPCAAPGCRNPRGGARRPNGVLIRKSLGRFGMDGAGCLACYNRLYAGAGPVMAATVVCLVLSSQHPVEPAVVAAVRAESLVRYGPRQRTAAPLDRLSPAAACRVIRRLLAAGRGAELMGADEFDLEGN